MLKAITITLALPLPLALATPITAANAAALHTINGSSFTSTPQSHVHPIAITDRKKYFSGKKKLKRLLKPHFRHEGFITKDVRAATGDPNIVVFDRRGGGDDVYQCSYITHKSKRALLCD